MLRARRVFPFLFNTNPQVRGSPRTKSYQDFRGIKSGMDSRGFRSEDQRQTPGKSSILSLGLPSLRWTNKKEYSNFSETSVSSLVSIAHENKYNRNITHHGFDMKTETYPVYVQGALPKTNDRLSDPGQNMDFHHWIPDFFHGYTTDRGLME